MRMVIIRRQITIVRARFLTRSSSPGGNCNPGKGKIPDLCINEDGKLLKEAFKLKAQHNLSYHSV